MYLIFIKCLMLRINTKSTTSIHKETLFLLFAEKFHDFKKFLPIRNLTISFKTGLFLCDCHLRIVMWCDKTNYKFKMVQKLQLSKKKWVPQKFILEYHRNPNIVISRNPKIMGCILLSSSFVIIKPMLCFYNNIADCQSTNSALDNLWNFFFLPAVSNVW